MPSMTAAEAEEAERQARRTAEKLAPLRLAFDLPAPDPRFAALLAKLRERCPKETP